MIDFLAVTYGWTLENVLDLTQDQIMGLMNAMEVRAELTQKAMREVSNTDLDNNYTSNSRDKIEDQLARMQGYISIKEGK